jgi:RNA polymerase-interacting CarD/CdnL/TRCF family regulator
MSTEEEYFTKGDWIVHAHYGVGQVKQKEKKILEGVKKVFLRVKTFNAEYWLPIKSTKVPHIRPLASEYQIKKALTLIRKPPNTLPKDYKRRGKEISQVLNDGSLYSKAQVIRDLHGRKMTKPLNQTEVALFDKIKQEFLCEWSVITNKDDEVLAEKLEQALISSSEKISDTEKDKNGENESWLEKVKKGVSGRRKIKNTS